MSTMQSSAEEALEEDRPVSPTLLAQANATHFDCEAHRYEKHAGTQELVRRVAHAMTKRYDFDEERTTVLDFACGIGMLSRALSPCARSIVGVDISAASVAEYNLRVANQGLEKKDMYALLGPLSGPPLELEGAQFDVAVCSMAYHHLPAIDETTALLARLLKPGGVLLVVDLMARHARSDDNARVEIFSGAHRHLVPHRYGFSWEEMKFAFEEAAGLEDFEFGTAFHGLKPQRHASAAPAKGPEALDVTFFIARGVKRAAGPQSVSK